MKFKCPKCNKIFKRDMREKVSKLFKVGKNKYRSVCDEKGVDVICTRVK